MATMKDAKARIKELSKLLGENDLTEIEMEQDGVRIRVSRAGGAVIPAAAPAAPAPDAATPPEENTMAKPPKSEPCDLPGCVKSPMVGTVFVSPEPGADPFIQVGDTVKKGQTLFIIEAMKVMNPITAHMGGKISQVLANDAQPIEFNEPLCVIE